MGTSLGALAASAAGAAVPGLDAHQEHSFHHDHILGTSLDVVLLGASATATRNIERLVLAEMERLRTIFSPFDPTSEASRFSRSTGPVAISADLATVLRQYDAWQQLSGGACSAQLGEIGQLWFEAQTRGVEPSPEALAEGVRRIAAPGWHLTAHQAFRTGRASLNLCSVAKGYAIGRAVEVVRNAYPELPSVLINLGGDLGGWGSWLVAVQDPQRPHENAIPLTTLHLRDQAVATSGGYQRGYRVADRWYSHLLDPRTGTPAREVLSATVVAPTSLVANALATILGVLSPEEGLRLIGRIAGAECLLVTAGGGVLRSRGLAALEVGATQEAGSEEKKPQKKAAWPENREVGIALEVIKPASSRRYRRPYVAVWIEDADGTAVRTVAVWGNASRWLPTMSGWWKVARGNGPLIKAVTRATRAPGSYRIVWDGKDDAGKPLPRGTYTVKVEVHREHGKHLFQTGKIVCEDEDARITLEKNAEMGETVVEYVKRK
ncbi:MAG: DUF2271 domain-containing protein [Gemmataceae bacterium]